MPWTATAWRSVHGHWQPWACGHLLGGWTVSRLLLSKRPARYFVCVCLCECVFVCVCVYVCVLFCFWFWFWFWFWYTYNVGVGVMVWKLANYTFTIRDLHAPLPFTLSRIAALPCSTWQIAHISVTPSLPCNPFPPMWPLPSHVTPSLLCILRAFVLLTLRDHASFVLLFS